MLRSVILAIGVLAMQTAWAEPAVEVRTLTEGQAPATAKIEQLAFLSGQWTGKGLGGEIDEAFSAPVNGEIVGYFRLTKSGKPVFYEFERIYERAGSLVFQVKHFSPDDKLTGWEEKDGVVEFRLVAVEGQTVYFHGLTLSRQGDRLRGAIALRNKGGTRGIEPLEYRRVP